MKVKKILTAGLAVPVVAGTLVLAGGQAGAAGTASQAQSDYTVLVADGGNREAAVRAIQAAGGTVTKENAAVGALVVRAPQQGFITKVAQAKDVAGATRARPVGQAPQQKLEKAKRDKVERESAAKPAPAEKAQPSASGMDPMDDALWGVKMLRSDLARTKQPGDKRVMVGILDTGVDGSHPDIAPNFSKELSRNFTQDLPYDENGAEVDGPCEYRGCVDPNDHDDSGHGTHVAGTIGAAVNGFGVSGVAPNVTLVNIRGGQDSGYFFLQPVVDALTYAGDAGLDVVNMSFYVDPWAFNCVANPADTPEQQLEQRTTIKAINRALNYAHNKGVTLVGALGNNHEDLGKPRTDKSSPNFPAGNTHERPIDNGSCFDLPVEGAHTIGVSSLGPSGKKSDFSNYGLEQISVAAPGGYTRDYYGTPWFNANENRILSTYPKNVLQAEGVVDADGNITEAGVKAGVKKYVQGDKVGYYNYLQGTSMASPHAAGVAALIVSQYGKNDRKHPGTLTLDPDKVENVLYKTATKRPCPTPRTVDYLKEGRSDEFTATCEGTTQFNGFYGHGIVDAWNAVTRGAEFAK
ncbi:subtilisin family serine protease [Crossiella equi]|uniref:Subtilisin family serine protease n=1 Tax=Crossiella equi TaxID=130796 RepID=A0ABS5AHQ3_9PSEU|nr:subtilisin family serine protease [Crossiella equi]